MRQSEFKKQFDPEVGKYVRKHIYGEGIFTDIAKKIFGPATKKLLGETMKKATTKAVETAATKTGKHLGNKAGDKIVNLLSKKKRKNQVSQLTTPISTTLKSTPKK